VHELREHERVQLRTIPDMRTMFRVGTLFVLAYCMYNGNVISTKAGFQRKSPAPGRWAGLQAIDNAQGRLRLPITL
jgi:hypothetical protein